MSHLQIFAVGYVCALLFVTVRRRGWGPISSYPMFRKKLRPEQLIVFALEVQDDDEQFQRFPFPYEHQVDDFDSALQRLHRRPACELGEWLRQNIFAPGARIRVVELTIGGQRVVYTETL